METKQETQDIQDSQSQQTQQTQQPQQQQQQQQQQPQQPNYTIPGILHYLQYEWHRFEVERQEWDVEKAELSARIALLQGEKKSHENLKHDLIRRIKMLEYCLRMERAKYHKLKHGTDPPPLQSIDDDPHKAQSEDGFILNSNNSSTVGYGRELLRHYLREIGYTDTIIDLRSNRVRSLLGLTDDQKLNNSQPTNQTSNNNSNDQKTDSPGIAVNNRSNSDIRKSSPFTTALLANNNAGNKQPGSVGDAEASVLATFGFLYEHEGLKDSSHLDDEEEEELISDEIVDAADRAASQCESDYKYFDKDCSEATAIIRQKSASDVVDIGELATLTNLGSETTVRKQWTAKYRLQSHYDSVRALKFSEEYPLLVTASEDETIKLWHLSKQSSNSGKLRQPNLPPSINVISSLESSSMDIEPLHTYRGHLSKILCITICKNHIFSGAQDGEIIKWKIISDPSGADQYDVFDSSLLVGRLIAHTDAVWSVEIVDQPNSESLLCSASADQTIKIWSANTFGEQTNLRPIARIEIDSYPSCIAKMPLYNVCQAGADFAVASKDGKIRLYDMATCLKNAESNTQPTATLECQQSNPIYSIVIHPTLPYLASAGKNHDIQFWDLKTHTLKSSIVAHLDEVTSLACDPTGTYLLSGSHDCSVRIWLFEESSCIQEITAHRKKFDEGVLAVTFHPELAHFATAGSDGLAKVFV